MNIVSEDNALKIIADQDFTIANAKEIQAQLLTTLESVKSDTQNVLLDLSKTTLLDSIGIKLVIGLLKSCQQKGLTLALQVASPAMMKVLQICKISQLLDIHEVAGND